MIFFLNSNCGTYSIFSIIYIVAEVIQINKKINTEMSTFRNNESLGMNETGQSFGNNPASLKGKLQTLEVLFYHKPSNK